MIVKKNSRKSAMAQIIRQTIFIWTMSEDKGKRVLQEIKVIGHIMCLNIG